MSSSSDSERRGPDHHQHLSREEKVRRLAQEYLFSQRLLLVIQGQMEKIQSQVLQARRDGQSPPSFPLGEAEQKILYRINNSGLVPGVAAGLLTLGGLRYVRRAFFRKLTQQQQKQQQRIYSLQPPFPPPPPPPTNSILSSPEALSSASSSSFSSSSPRSVSSWAKYVLEWSLDLFASFSIMVTVSIAAFGRPKLLSDLASLPLVEGRSRVAEEICPVVGRELARIRQEIQAAEKAAAPATSSLSHLDSLSLDQLTVEPGTAADDSKRPPTPDERLRRMKQALEDPLSPYWAALLQFGHNCQHRARYEAQLRREKGVSPQYPVSIPPPGVPVPSDWEENDQQNWDDDTTAAGDPSGNLEWAEEVSPEPPTRSSR